MLGEVPPHDVQLLALLVPKDVELGHVGGEDTEEDRAGPEGCEVDNAGVDVLRQAHRRDLVHATGKLGKSPTQGHDVAVIQALLCELILHEPVAVLGTVFAYGVPYAGQKVASAQHYHDEFEDIQKDHELFRGQALGNEVDDLADLCEAQEPQHAEDAKDPRGFAHTRQVNALDSLVHHDLQPINAHHKHVHQKPGLHVPLRDWPGAHLDGAICRHIARQEGDRNVQGPKYSGRPFKHQHHCGDFRIEEAEGDHNHVVED
mmetsp:Transcript_105043/g.338707  ORF Transcript_105043/g.338707 Transcript_105043/m.338707 type:complete len:260 (+) Transcript_105043:1055-1834(+)